MVDVLGRAGERRAQPARGGAADGAQRWNAYDFGCFLSSFVLALIGAYSSKTG